MTKPKNKQPSSIMRAELNAALAREEDYKRRLAAIHTQHESFNEQLRLLREDKSKLAHQLEQETARRAEAERPKRTDNPLAEGNTVLLRTIGMGPCDAMVGKILQVRTHDVLLGDARDMPYYAHADDHKAAARHILSNPVSISLAAIALVEHWTIPLPALGVRYAY